MSDARISGKKLVLIGGLLLLLTAAGIRMFAVSYLRNMHRLPPTTQPLPPEAG
jgi:hypothetical protein